MRKLTTRIRSCLQLPIMVGGNGTVTDSDKLLRKGTSKLARLTVPLDALLLLDDPYGETSLLGPATKLGMVGNDECLLNSGKLP
jgi:hypothetical protein